MLLRLLTRAGLFGLGYSLGREIGRMEAIREALRQLREAARHGTGATAGGRLPGHRAD